MPTANEVKRETLNIHIKPEPRDLIDHAAKSRARIGPEFTLDSARLAAEDAQLDQVNMSGSPRAFADFSARLDMPPKADAWLRKTMQTPAPWEKI